VGRARHQVSGFKAGDLVVAPFVWSDGTCDFRREGLHGEHLATPPDAALHQAQPAR
jgi:threonine dehydrogenase-like Zn-dependent dehydrogenase